jgi:hypothetical protein
VRGGGSRRGAAFAARAMVVVGACAVFEELPQPASTATRTTATKRIPVRISASLAAAT